METKTTHRAAQEDATPSSHAAGESPPLARIDPPHAPGNSPAHRGGVRTADEEARLADAVELAEEVAEEVAEEATLAAPGEDRTEVDDLWLDATCDSIAAATGRSAPHLTAQLHAQALQLAEYLREKQRQLDRREALQNARDAKLENELRLARLWTRQRDEEVAERERSFAERERDLQRRAEQTAAAELAIEQACHEQQAVWQAQERLAAERDAAAEAELARLAAEQEALEDARARLEQQRVEQATERLALEQQLAARQAELQTILTQQLNNIERARQALEERERALEQRAAQLSGASDRQAWEGRLAARQRSLDQAEALLATHARELDEQRTALAQAQEAWQAERAATEQHGEEQRAARQAALDERQRRLALAEEALDEHRAAVEQLRGETARLHREAIEMRLIAEQIWLELARHVPAADLTRSLSTLRQRLAEHYREQHQELAGRQAELVRLGQRLDEQQRRLRDQREQNRAWIAAQQGEIEAQSARLIAREQEIAREQDALRARETLWRDERRALRQQVRELLAHARRPAAA